MIHCRIRRQRGLKNLAVLFLFVATLLMYASSVAYWVSLLLNAIGLFNIVQSYGVQLACQAHFLLLSSFNPTHSPPDTCTSSEYGLRGAVRGLTLCAPTIILAINVRFRPRWDLRVLSGNIYRTGGSGRRDSVVEGMGALATLYPSAWLMSYPTLDNVLYVSSLPLLIHFFRTRS